MEKQSGSVGVEGRNDENRSALVRIRWRELRFRVEERAIYEMIRCQ